VMQVNWMCNRLRMTCVCLALPLPCLAFRFCSSIEHLNPGGSGEYWFCVVVVLSCTICRRVDGRALYCGFLSLFVPSLALSFLSFS